jgi:hypothetical protein
VVAAVRVQPALTSTTRLRAATAHTEHGQILHSPPSSIVQHPSFTIHRRSSSASAPHPQPPPTSHHPGRFSAAEYDRHDAPKPSQARPKLSQATTAPKPLAASALPLHTNYSRDMNESSPLGALHVSIAEIFRAGRVCRADDCCKAYLR